jgi:hypothetical protein
MRNHWRTSLIAAAICVTLGACGRSAGKVAATVEGDRIPKTSVEKLADGWLKAPQMQNEAMQRVLTPQRVRQMALLQLVRMTYLQKVARQYGVSLSSTAIEHAAASGVPAEELRNVGWESGNFQEALQAAQLSRDVAERVFPTVTVANDRTQRYFTEHPELFRASWKASAQVAFFRDGDKAQRYAAAASPGENFVKEAPAAGADEATDVESVTPDNGLPGVLLERVRTTAQGTVAQPLKVDTGFWVVAVTKRVDLPPQTFDEARPSIENHLMDQQRQELFSNWLDKQVKSANVSVAKQYGKWPFDV